MNEDDRYFTAPPAHRRESLYTVLAGEKVVEPRIFLEVGKVSAEGHVPEDAWHYYAKNGSVVSWTNSEHGVALATEKANFLSRHGYHAQVLRVFEPDHRER